MISRWGTLKYQWPGLALLPLTLLLPLEAPALGLGDAEVRSFLNQPLEVVIPLTVNAGAERDGLKIDLASDEDFRRVGLNRANLTVPITVELIDTAGGVAVRLTSSRPITDPFLQLLLDANWSSGRLLRQYTLFLDPPLAGEPTLAVQPEPAFPAPSPKPQVSPPLPEREAAAPPPPRTGEVSEASAPVVQTAPAAPATPQAVAPETPAGDVYGPVAAGETLWSIAERYNPDRSGYSNNQVMLAFVRLNPEAFDDGNINRLHKGAELIVPDREAIAMLDADQARQIASEQHAAWRALGGGAGKSRAVPLAVLDEVPPAATENDVRTQLKLVPPESDGEDLPERDSATVRAELSRLEEELMTTRLENQDLARQVQDLRDELQHLRGLEVVDPELAEFQDYLADRQQPGGAASENAETAGEAQTQESTATPSSDSESVGIESPEADTTVSDALPSAASKSAATTPPPPAAPPAEPDRTWVTTSMILIAAIGFFAILALVWLQKRRRGEAVKTTLADRLVRAEPKLTAKTATTARPPAVTTPVRSVRSPLAAAPTAGKAATPPAAQRPAHDKPESAPLDETTRALLQRLQAEDERLAGDAPTAPNSTPASTATSTPAPTAEEDDGGLDFDRDAARELLRRGGESEKFEAKTSADPDPFDSVLKLVKNEDEEVFAGDEGGAEHGLPGGSGEDDIEIKLDLARAYISMGDADAARAIIDEVMEEGNPAQRAEGSNLLKQI